MKLLDHTFSLHFHRIQQFLFAYLFVILVISIEMLSGVAVYRLTKASPSFVKLRHDF